MIDGPRATLHDPGSREPGVHVFEIREFGDVVESGNAIRRGATVEVSIGSAPPELRRRVLDFFAGVAVAGGATMTKVAPGVFRLVPHVEPQVPRRIGVSPTMQARDSGLLSLPRARPVADVKGLAQIAGYGSRRR